MPSYPNRTFGKVWSFKTRRFTVSLELERIRGYQYDGDDDGETQAALDSGDYVAFESSVIVELDCQEIARDSLYGSVYRADDVAAFYTDHRTVDPMNRNCSIMRAANGGNVSIGHYFPDMVKQAIDAARDYVRDMTIPPYIRESAQ